MLTYILLAKFPNDSGPIYRETIQGRFPIEPLNTLSNLFFLAIVIYFSYCVYKNFREQLFLTFAIPVLFVGWVGGTIYHATRSHEIWLLMDWVPIVLLCLAAALYFATKASRKKRKIAVLMLVVLTLVFGIRIVPFKSHAENFGYIATAIGLILPIVIHMWQTKFRNSKYMVFAILSFVVAICFRALDRYTYFSIGTHWLWHTFGAFCVFFLMKYIFMDARSNRLHA